MAKAKKESTELAVKDEAAALEELNDFFDDPDGVDGLGDFEGEDVKISSILWNMGGKDKSGKTMTKDVFLDTITEQTSETIDLVMLTSKKTKRWDEYDEDKKETVVHCQSNDRKMGTLSDGTRRPCADCPDDGWHTNEKGKSVRKCGEVHNVVAVERLTQKPVMIRFKKTGLKPFRQYVSTHHKNARVVVMPDGTKKRRNVPLFAYACRVSLEMSDNGMYATPVLNPIEQSKGADGEPTYLLPTHDVMAYGALAKEWSAQANEAIQAADKQAQAYDDAPSQSSGIDADEFADD